jgi:GH24 family phage-related lysozyme (muramidase)
MKLESKWYLLLIIGFIIFYNLIQIVKKYDRLNNMYLRTQISKDLYKYNLKFSTLASFSDTIAKYEGITTKPYKQGKYWYIGIGHQTKDSVHCITTNDAKNLITYDLESCLDEGNKLTHLKGNKLLCIADFIFCYGSPTFIKSTLFKVIKANPYDTLNIRIQLYKWIYYNGTELSQLRNRRYYNWKLYSQNN